MGVSPSNPDLTSIPDAVCRLLAVAIQARGPVGCEDIIHVTTPAGRHYVFLGEVHKYGRWGRIRRTLSYNRIPDPIRLFVEVRRGQPLQVDPEDGGTNHTPLMVGAVTQSDVVGVDPRSTAGTMLFDLLKDHDFIASTDEVATDCVLKTLETGMCETLGNASHVLDECRSAMTGREWKIASTFLRSLRESWLADPNVLPNNQDEMERVLGGSVDAAAFALLCARASPHKLNVLHAGAAHTDIVAELFRLAGARVRRVRNHLESEAVLELHRQGRKTMDTTALEHVRAAMAREVCRPRQTS